MGEGSVGTATKWRLKLPHASRAQGVLVSAFGSLPAAEALFLELPPRAGGGWLGTLRETVKITAADLPRDPAATIAFTWTGLQAMGVPDDALATFSTPFIEGMHEENRQRRLGDHREAGLTIAGGALWSGNAPYRDPAGRNAAAPPTRITVHAVLFLYARTDQALEAEIERARGVLQAENVRVAHNLRLSLREDARKQVKREHFGFADGISQPMPFGDTIMTIPGPRVEEELKWHGIAAGEIFLGHQNAHEELAPGPLVKDSPEAKALPKDDSPEGFRNLGLDGSYMVVRQLKQDVAEFWNSLERAAQAIGDPGIDAQWLAERIVGRTCDGAPLAPRGSLPNDADGQPANLFGFAEKDIDGLGCPLGSHTRRGNPRDSLPSRDGSETRGKDASTLLVAANNHRILRRGRKYGPDIADPRVDDGQDRGLLFICLNSDIARHFEFIQQTWMLNRSFATLSGESDPLLGPKGPFTIPQEPVRRRPQVEAYVKFVGGEYFFVPSIPALDYLSLLAAPPAPASPPV